MKKKKNKFKMVGIKSVIEGKAILFNPTDLLVARELNDKVEALKIRFKRKDRIILTNY